MNGLPQTHSSQLQLQQKKSRFRPPFVGTLRDSVAFQVVYHAEGSGLRGLIPVDPGLGQRPIVKIVSEFDR